MEKKQQIYFRTRKPNPLFVQWLEHWLEEAVKKDLAKKFALSKALESLKKYPLVLYSGRECSILEGFGTTICKMLDKQLEIYRTNNPNQIANKCDIEAYENSILQEVKCILDKEQEEKLMDHQDEIELLYRKYDIIDSKSMQISKKNAVTSTITSMDLDPVRVKLSKGNFDVILLVDTQETSG